MVYISLLENNRIKLVMPYNEPLIEKIKQIEGKAWDSKQKFWNLPCDKKTVDKILYIFKGLRIDLHRNILNTDVGKYIKKHLENNQLKNCGLIQVINEFTLRGLSFRTIKTYKSHLLKFRNYLNKPLEQATISDVRNYLLNTMRDNNLSHSYVGQAISALKYYYEKILNRTEPLRQIYATRKNLEVQPAKIYLPATADRYIYQLASYTTLYT